MSRQLFVLLLLLSTNGLAQRLFLSLGPEVEIPNGLLAGSAETGFGGSVRLEYHLTRRLEAIGTVGYLAFGQKSFTNSALGLSFTSRVTMVPVQAGAKYYLLSNGANQKAMYLSGEAGFHTLTLQVTVNGTSAHPPDETKFSYAPGIGLRFGNFDLSYRQLYVATSGESLNYSSVRLAFVFKT